MKKLLTLLVAAMACHCTNAQNVTISQQAHRPQLKSPVSNTTLDNYHPIVSKSTAFMDRWYNHTALVDQMTGTMNYSLMPIWHDSTVLEVFSNSIVGQVNFSSMAEVFDPIHFTMWNDTLYFSDSLMTVSDTDAYNVDSISFSGALRRGTANRPPSIVDTFILSIAVNNFPEYATNCVTDPWASYYISCQPGDDTVRGVTIFSDDVDSLQRTQQALNGAIVWKIPIVDSMRHDSLVIDHFTYEVPGGLQVPAGKGFAVTVTFKSGDTWPVNVDTFSEYHNFSALTGEAYGQGQLMPYYYYQYNDRGMSNTMFSVDSSFYAPNVFIEGWNTAAFKYEFHDISAHIGCNGCLTIAARKTASVENLELMQIKSAAYPVPATDEVNITFSLEENANTTVSINNALGQQVATQSVGAKANLENKVVFNTSALPAGVYFYTIEANGQRTTNRFAVAR